MMRALQPHRVQGLIRLLDHSSSSLARTCCPANHLITQGRSGSAQAKRSPNVQPTQSGEEVSVFYKPSPRVININVDGLGAEQFHEHTYDSDILKQLESDVRFRKDVLEAIQLAEEQEKKLEESAMRTKPIEETKMKECGVDVRSLPKIYQRLAKRNLTGLIVVTAAAGYGLAPGAFDLSTFLLCCTGTALTSSAANAINQYLEVPYDSQMPRTYTRPLVTGQISPLHAVGFAGVSAISGLSMLYWGVSPLVAGLGAFNLLLYTSAYTPMKRISIANTWVGAVVGAIPPMMGWAACSGGLEPGAWLLAAILYCWQFPHFNALSWKHKAGYSRAGYRMTSVVNPGMCRRVALRHSLFLCGLTFVPPALGMVEPLVFVPAALAINGFMALKAWKFYRNANSSTSTGLFFTSLWHLPALMAVMFLCTLFNLDWLKDKAKIPLSPRNTAAVKEIS